MFANTSINSVIAVLARSGLVAPADTTLQDGSVLSGKPAFIVTYTEAEAGISPAAGLIRIRNLG